MPVSNLAKPPTPLHASPEPQPAQPAKGNPNPPLVYPADPQKPWLHPSELPFLEHLDWSQDTTLTYLVQNVFSVPEREAVIPLPKGARIGKLGAPELIDKNGVGMGPNGGVIEEEGRWSVKHSKAFPFTYVERRTVKDEEVLEPTSSAVPATVTNPMEMGEKKRITYLPKAYRIPLMFVAKFQWESLRLVMTSGDTDSEWARFQCVFREGLFVMCANMLFWTDMTFSI